MADRRFNGSLFFVDKKTGARLHGPMGVCVKKSKIVDSSERWMVNGQTAEEPLEKLKREWPTWDYELLMDNGDAYYAGLKKALGLPE